jgi:hypothetical protein
VCRMRAGPPDKKCSCKPGVAQGPAAAQDQQQATPGQAGMPPRNSPLGCVVLRQAGTHGLAQR